MTVGAAAAALGLRMEPAQAAESLSEAVAGGKPILEVRARYESVDQAGFADEAQAFTVRTRAGWETASWGRFKGLLEFEDIRAIGGETYNVAVPGVVGASINGRTRYPVINDPEVTELNRAQITWTPAAFASVTLGRQRIVIEDQRFVGAIAWRQDEQTFDAVRADFAHGRWKATYAYVGQVNRVLGEARDWDADSHLATVTYAASDVLRLHGFAFLQDFANAPANSNQTYGVKASGRVRLDRVQVAYNAAYANQTDYRGNSAPFDLGYWEADVAGTLGVWTLKATYEVLEGDGTRGFVTPLATAHAFNGWSDAFAAVAGNKTFVDGLEDKNLQLSVRPRLSAKRLSNVELIARYHDFDAQRTGASLGHEWNLQATAAITSRIAAGLKFARFRQEDSVPVGTAVPPASRSKFWAWIEYRL